MKNTFNIILLLSAVLFTVSSCADWTKPESIEFKYTTLQEKNPQLYEQYIESIRQYHKTEHTILIARVDNISGQPASSAERLDCLPDSVDMVILNNIDNINTSTLDEISSIRDKGIKTLARISYEDIISEYEDAVEAQGLADTKMERVEWVQNKTTEFIHTVRSNELDGAVFSYNGRSTIPLGNSDKEQYVKLQDAFFESAASYKESHSDKLFIFEGTPKYVTDDEFGILDMADYIIFQTEDATGVNAFTYLVDNSIDENSPVEKYIVCVDAIDDADDLSTEGIMSDGSSAIVGSAYWVNIASSKYEKAGVCVNHAQRDYYGVESNYSDIRKAISIMNPSPIK